MASDTPPPRPAAASRRALALGLALLLTVGLATAVFWIFFRYEVFPKRLVELEEGRLFRSGQISPRLVHETLAQNGIQVVIDLQPPFDSPEQAAENQAIARLGIEQLRFPLGGDGTGDPKQYTLAIAAIDRAQREQKTTLVHCAAGSRRAGGVIAMYELLVAGKSADEAYAELERYGSPPVAETPLLPFLNDNMRSIAEGLAREGVIDRVPVPLPRFAPR